jgi:DNA-binding transcriptional regulator LsrR (DeoR family)
MAPPKRDRDLILQIARMRFEAGRSQRDIARSLGLSDATISRALKEAFDLNLVEVRVRAPPERNAELERALISRFGLAHAVVVETQAEPGRTVEVLGRAVAGTLSFELADDMTIGVGDGDNAAAVAASLPRLWLNNIEVVPLIGGVGQLEMASHPVEVARMLAARLGGRVRQLPAPAVAPDAATAAKIIASATVADAFAAMKRSSVAVVGVGPIDADTSLVKHGALTKDELGSIAAGGAVGMICARAYDWRGAHLPSEIDSRTLAIGFDAFKRIPKRWVVGPGLAKAAALRAAFAGEVVTACGTDAAAAREVLRDA